MTYLPTRENFRINIAHGNIDNLIVTTNNYFVDYYRIIIDVTTRNIDTCEYSAHRIIIPWSMIEGELYAKDGSLCIKDIEINVKEHSEPKFPKDWLLCCYLDENDFTIPLREFVDVKLKEKCV